MNILITGGNGYLAKSITKLLSDTYKIESVCRNDFDLTNTDATMKWFENKHYDVIVHTAIKGGSRLLNEDESVLENNIKMYMNLAQCTNSFSRLINVGSGAEFITPGSFYGLSKRVINNHIETQDNFFNLRIYAVFDENELESRFIKSNLYRYIAKQPIIIHQNKYMDFIYMQDFIKILDWFIRKNHLPKSIDCVYEKKYSLVDIANLINNLDTYKVDINIENVDNDTDYTGTYHNLKLDFIGLEEGINNTYRKINNEKNMVCS